MSEEVIAEAAEAAEAAVEPSSNPYGDLIGKELGDDFYKSLPDGLGDHSAVRKYKTVEDAYKGLVNANQLLGKKTEDWITSDDPQVVAMRNKFNAVPENASDYTYESPEIPEGMETEVLTDLTDRMKSYAKENNIPAKEAEKFLRFAAEEVIEGYRATVEESTQRNEAAVKALRDKWPGDSMEKNVEVVKSICDELGLENLKNHPALANDAEVIYELRTKLSPLVSDDRLVELRNMGNGESIDAQINSLGDKMYAYSGNTRGEEYKKMQGEMERLLKIKTA